MPLVWKTKYLWRQDFINSTNDLRYLLSIDLWTIYHFHKCLIQKDSSFKFALNFDNTNNIEQFFAVFCLEGQISMVSLRWIDLIFFIYVLP